MKVKNIFKLAYIYFLSFISRALRERINRKVYRCSVTRTTNFSLYFFFISRQPLTFPGRLQPSIISRLCLNRRVRYGYGCFPSVWVRVFPTDASPPESFSGTFPAPSKPNTVSYSNQTFLTSYLFFSVKPSTY